MCFSSLIQTNEHTDESDTSGDKMFGINSGGKTLAAATLILPVTTCKQSESKLTGQTFPTLSDL